MKRLLIIFLFLLSLVSCQVPEIPDEEPILPKEEEPSFPSLFYNPYGFASLVITDRSEISDAYASVDDVSSFLDALMDDEIHIIEITSSLDLGSKVVEEELKQNGRKMEDYRRIYRPHHFQPLLHPVLKESGIGLVRIVQKNNLMIFSKNAAEIKHANFSIDGSENIIIRNLVFTELWEWDEKDNGQYKHHDWDYFTIEKSNGIWFDHLSFDQAYDGIIDVKEESSNLTISFSKFNFVPSDFITEQVNYLENNREENPYYNSLRNNLSKEEIEKWASYQKKGFNLGNTTDGEGYESISFTFHHLEVFNLQDRLPRIRKGDAHLYHIILDNTELDILSKTLNKYGLSIVNQAIVTTEGGAVLMENSIFKNVASPIKNHQDSNSDPKYTGKFKVRDSELIRNQKTSFGSSGDGRSLWYPSNQHPQIEFSFRNYQVLPYQYQLIDIYYLPEFLEEYPTGAQELTGFNWLKINPN